MPRHNHPRRNPRGRNIAPKAARVGTGLDALADREQRAVLIADWVRVNGQEIRDRWHFFRSAGTNKTPKRELVICHECDHHIPHGDPVCVASWTQDGPKLAFHWKRGHPNCWTRFLSRQVQEAAARALFTDTHQESA